MKYLFYHTILVPGLAVLLTVAAGSAWAAPVTVLNAGFEQPALPDGMQTSIVPAWSNGVYDAAFPTTWIPSNTMSGAFNPDNFFGHGGLAPEGSNAAYAFTIAGFLSGFRQILATNLEANSRYELTALVGNPVGYNAEPTADYRVELLAGDTLLAADYGPSPIDDSYWTTSRIVFYSGAAPAQLGQALEIRLMAQDFLYDSYIVDFDDIKLDVVPGTDTNAPTPDPMTFAVLPFALDSSTVVMTSSTAFDMAVPVEYEFLNVTNLDRSGWIKDTTWTNDGLTEGVTYGYQVRARDQAGNTSGWSAVADVTAMNETNPPTPNPMTFAMPPASQSGTSIIMTATTAADPSGPITYEFFNTSNSVSSGWITNTTWLNVGLTNGSTYGYRVRARDVYGNTGGWSVVEQATAMNETNPPTPNPMTFAVAPAPLNASSIDMTATTAADASGPVEYYFENTSNAHNSGWMTSTTWIDTGLSNGVTYGYRVRARDAFSNETAWSSELMAVPEVVLNLGFERPLLPDGDFTGVPLAWSNGYYDLTDPTVWVSNNAFAGAYNPAFFHGYGGLAPEGSNVGATVSMNGFESGLNNVLPYVLESNTLYSLSALVGNPVDVNGGVTANYRIELVAGGVVLASASGPSPVDDALWITSRVDFASGPVPAQLGQPLEIRVLALDYFDFFQVDFDDVQLAVVPGVDTNPPTPNPMTFSLAPSGVDASNMIMRASVAEDASGPVEYYFENTSNGSFSGWSTSTAWTNGGLTPDAVYGYRVRARDQAGNTGAWSAVSRSVAEVGPNFGFELPLLTDGFATFSPTAWSNGFYDVSAPTVWINGGGNAGIYDPDVMAGYGGVVPEGENAGFAISASGFDNGLGQVLSTTLQPDTRYDLSALVGNPFLFNFGPTADYRIELLAGGVLLASTTGASPPDDSFWTSASLSYTSSVAPAQLGEALEIRLLAVDSMGFIQVDFDQVQLDILPLGLSDLVLTKTVNESMLFSMSNLTYTLTVSNLGAATAGGVTITDTLPSSVVFIGSVPPPNVVTNNMLVYQLAPLAFLEAASVTVQVSVVDGATGITNIAMVATTNSEDILSNNWAAAITLLNDADMDGVSDLIDPDDDNDLFPDLAETIAGTDPLDAGSFLQLSILRTGTTDVQMLSFSSATGRLYRLQERASLTTGSWSNIESNIPGTGGTVTWPSTNVLQRNYYRVGVETP